MDISKLTISPDTLKERSMTNRETAELRLAKLREIPTESWAKFRRRTDIANYIGIFDKTVGASWAFNMIRSRRITEEPNGVYLPGPNINDPYKKTRKNKKVPKVAPTVKPNPSAPKITKSSAPNAINMQIIEGGTVIAFNSLTVGNALKILKEIKNGLSV